MRRMTLASMMAIVLMMLGIGVAAADPANSPNAQFFEISCENGETYDIVVGGGNPGHIVGSNGLLMPVSFTFTMWDLSTGEMFSETEPLGNGHRYGVQDDLITCSTDVIAEVDPELGEIEFQIEVDAFLTPRGR